MKYLHQIFAGLVVCVMSVPALAQAGLTLAQPTGYSVTQRDNNNLADLRVEGTFTSGVTQVQARVIPRAGEAGVATAWQNIGGSIGGGQFAGQLPGVSGGWYDIEVRALNGTNVVQTTSMQRVGVGEVFVMAGQSNSANFGGATSPAQSDAVVMRTSYTQNTWAPADDPQPLANGGGGSPWPKLGDLIYDQHDVPVGLISVGVGGSSVQSWKSGQGNYENRLKPVLQSLGEDGFRAVLWHQGETNSLQGTSANDYQAHLESVIAQSRTDAGFDVQWGVAIASYHPGATAETTAQVALGQQQTIDADPLVFKGAVTDGLITPTYGSGPVHFTTEQLAEHSLRWFNAIEAESIVIPEPSSLMLMGLGGVLIGARRRRG